MNGRAEIVIAPETIAVTVVALLGLLTWQFGSPTASEPAVLSRGRSCDFACGGEIIRFSW